MKIKDLKLLFKHHMGGFCHGAKLISNVSWADWELEEIVGDKLFIKVREGIRRAGEKSEVTFCKVIYDKLTDEEKTKVNDIFKENIGNTIEKILEIDFV